MWRVHPHPARYARRPSPGEVKGGGRRSATIYFVIASPAFFTTSFGVA